MNIFSKLNKLTNLTANEKTLVSYMKDNPESFIKMSAIEISEECFISTSTIYRLCQKLDLSGLSELKVQVSVSINEYLKEHNSLDYNYPFNQNETQYQITSKKKNKTIIILISSTNDNSLTNYANYNLYLSSNENHFNKISSFSTRLSLLYLLDCIYTCYFKLDYDNNVTFKLDTYRKLSKNHN